VSRWPRPRSVRMRLTLWYTGILACVLVAYAAAVFLFLRHALYRDLDRRLHEDLHLLQEELDVTDDGRLVWRSSGHPDEAEGSGTPRGRWLEVWTREGQLVLRSASSEPLSLGPPEASEEPRLMTTIREGSRVRVSSAIQTISGVPVLVRAARSEEPVRRELRELLVIQAFAVPLALALAAGGGYYLARRALGPVARMVEKARSISAERLGERLPVENPADTFNETFRRLDRSFDQLRRFTADASHELRTPLTALRSVGEVGLQERPDDKLFAEVVGSMLEEVDALTRLVDTLLALSRADAGHVRLAREVVELAELARSSVQHLDDLAEEKRQALSVQAAETAEVLGDRLVLRQALINILDNAIKHSPEGTRSREQGGAGLGLSLAKWGVESHDGQILLDSELGRGSTFRIVLPLLTAGGSR
jgi:signal transduction histidine kinase